MMKKTISALLALAFAVAWLYCLCALTACATALQNEYPIRLVQE